MTILCDFPPKTDERLSLERAHVLYTEKQWLLTQRTQRTGNPPEVKVTSSRGECLSFLKQAKKNKANRLFILFIP